MPELTETQWLLVLMGAAVVVLVGIFAVVTYAVASGGVTGGAVGDGDDKPHPTLAWLAKEPAVIAGFVGAAAALTAAFGFDLSAEQVGAIIAFISVVLGIAVRQSVYSGETVSRSGLAFDPKDGTLKRRVK